MKKNKRIKTVIISATILIGVILSVLLYFTLFYGKQYIPDDQRIKSFYTIGGSIQEYSVSDINILSESFRPFLVRVVGYVRYDDTKMQTTYSLEVIEVYNDELKKYIGNKFTVNYPGTPQNQYYGFPRMAADDTYLLITNPETVKNRGLSGIRDFMFYIQNIYGVDYAYPINVDCSGFGVSERFKYVEEAQIYKKYKDWDTLRMLNKSGLNNLEFSYKITLSRLLDEYTKMFNLAFFE